MPGSHIPEHVSNTHVYHLPAPTENILKTYMKYQYECDKQTDRQSVTSSNVSRHILKVSVPRFCKKQKNANFQGCLRLGLSWFNWWVSFAPEFLCCYFCESSCLFYLSFNFDFYVSKIMHL